MINAAYLLRLTTADVKNFRCNLKLNHSKNISSKSGSKSVSDVTLVIFIYLDFIKSFWSSAAKSLMDFYPQKYIVQSLGNLKSTQHLEIQGITGMPEK